MHLPASYSSRSEFLDDVVQGLSRPPRSIPSKYFYDEEGSRLFDEITLLPEYYPTRTERAILTDNMEELARAVGSGAVLIEFGSGSSDKTRHLLDELPDLAAYVPIDISGDHLSATARNLAERYPHLTILPVAADYTADYELPDLPPHSRRIGFFPGSTIGNLEREGAERFLRRIRALVGDGGGLILGADLKKDPAVLLPAYNDEAGVTAAFNKNVLARIRDELGGELDVDGFAHLALWNEDESRIEMYLLALEDQVIRINGRQFDIAAGEAIHTENSHKYTHADLERVASRAGFAVTQTWIDEDGYFTVKLLESA